MDERLRQAVGGEEAYVVGGAVRDELLGRPGVDLDIACPTPVKAARSYAGLAGGAVFPLSDRHGAWRVAFRDGRTVDFTPLPDGIEADLGTRDFTINAIAIPLAGGEPVDPFGGRGDLEAGVLRAVSPRSSRTIRFACCVPPGSKTSSECVSTMRPSVWRGLIASSSRALPGSASWAS